MPAFATAPATHAIGNAIVSYLTNLTYSDGITTVYQLAQLEEIKDVTDQVANGACGEVYGNLDGSERRGFGGRMWDIQTWYILSMVPLDTAASAATIYDVRDALVQPFQQHALLGTQVPNLFHAQLKENSGRFLKVLRNGQWLRGHLIELETRQEWQVPIPPGVIS